MRRTYHYPRALVLLQPALAAPGQAEQLREVDVTVVPVEVEWERNDLNEADEATVTLDWADLPLDPRALRDCRLIVYCADVEDDERALVASDRSAVRFIGFVDEPELDFSEDAQRVTLRARDYTGRLLDARWPSKEILVDRPLSACVREILAQVPPYIGTELQIEDDRSVRSVTGKRRWHPPAGTSCWDCIVGLAKELGQTPRWELGKLVIGPPQPVTAQEARIVLYGDQVHRMTMRRSLNPVAGKRIVFRALDVATRKVLEGVWPPPKADEKRDEVAYTLPAGAWSAATLRDRAKQVYTLWERRQVTGTFETRAMTDLDDADLVGLASGDPLYLRARSMDRSSVLGMSCGQLADWLRDHGMSPQASNALANAWATSEDLATLFYVVRAKHRWSRDDGYTLTADFGNSLGV